MSTEIITSSENSDTIIARLGAELERVNALHAEVYGLDDESAKELDDRRWAIRALIVATPAETPADLQAIAHALKAEATRDEDFECDVPGSARDLARALADGYLRLAGAAHPA